MEPAITLGEGVHDGLLVPVLWDLVVSKLDILVRVGESGIPGSAHTAACTADFCLIVSSSGHRLSIVGSGAEGHSGDEDDLGEGRFKATERSTSKGGGGQELLSCEFEKNFGFWMATL